MSDSLSCSVIIPCHNEEENIAECIQRTPDIGKFTEIVVVDDGSTDRTGEVVKEIASHNKNVRLVSLHPNQGKGSAVRAGFNAAQGDVLMILDADMTVEPEELPRFFAPLKKGEARAVNGSRMIYPMEKGAMGKVRYLGNIIFGRIFSFLMGQRLTDTLCGTKVIFKEDYRKMEMGRCPWGDFDILIGIAKLGLKMVEVPVHYKRRKAGESKMKVLHHGMILFKMCWYAFKKLKLERTRS